MNLDFLLGFLQIVIIDLALSGDNAIVIGMAAASLPHKLRIRAIFIGGACAIALRIALTAIVATLIKITLLSAIAGAVLFWVAWKLLRLNVKCEEEEEEEKARCARNFRQAIFIILTADFMMSLDNILAIAGASHGSYPLLIIGLLISMPLLMTTGSIIARLIDKFQWIPFVGAAVICFTASRMILEDKFIEPRLGIHDHWIVIISILVGILVPVIILLINKLAASNKKSKNRLPNPPQSPMP
jgi:YjbE family integral membrane protein